VHLRDLSVLHMSPQNFLNLGSISLLLITTKTLGPPSLRESLCLVDFHFGRSPEALLPQVLTKARAFDFHSEELSLAVTRRRLRRASTSKPSPTLFQSKVFASPLTLLPSESSFAFDFFSF